MYIYTYVYISKSIYLSINLSIHLSIYIYINIYICIYIHEISSLAADEAFILVILHSMNEPIYLGGLPRKFALSIKVRILFVSSAGYSFSMGEWYTKGFPEDYVNGMSICFAIQSDSG